MLILILKLLWTYHIPHSSINIFTAKNAQGNDLNKFFSFAILYSKQNILSLYIIVEKEPTIIAHKNNNRGFYSWSYNKELLIELILNYHHLYSMYLIVMYAQSYIYCCNIIPVIFNLIWWCTIFKQNKK